jgi:large subunit ribosomal protein L4
MMDLNLTTATGKASKKKIEVSDANFADEFNEALVHQVVTAYLAGARSGTRKTKSRSDVRGGGAKPWRQKGTGRARAGTMSSPLWRTGGMTFALRPQDHAQKVNRKMYRSAMRKILSELVRQDRLVVIDELKLEAPKTKLLAEKLKTLGLTNALIVTDELDDNLDLASRNLRNVAICQASRVNPVVLVNSDKILITVNAIKHVEGMLA